MEPSTMSRRGFLKYAALGTLSVFCYKAARDFRDGLKEAYFEANANTGERDTTGRTLIVNPTELTLDEFNGVPTINFLYQSPNGKEFSSRFYIISDDFNMIKDFVVQHGGDSERGPDSGSYVVTEVRDTVFPHYWVSSIEYIDTVN